MTGLFCPGLARSWTGFIWPRVMQKCGWRGGRTERERTGIKSLKVSYNSVFGYYIEVTHANAGRCQAITSASKRSPMPSVTLRLN